MKRLLAFFWAITINTLISNAQTVQKIRKVATDYYVEALGDIKKMKVSSQAKQQISAIIDDINNASKKYPAMKNGSDIKALFLQELKSQ